MRKIAPKATVGYHPIVRDKIFVTQVILFMNDQKVIIVGAGLAGSLLAIYLAKKGFTVDIYESRHDMRREKMSAGRSINLALSNRGIAALREVGLDEYMLTRAIPMQGR